MPKKSRLVGDMKYNPDRFEHDCALVPRIFLHCLRMEFQDGWAKAEISWALSKHVGEFVPQMQWLYLIMLHPMP